MAGIQPQAKPTKPGFREWSPGETAELIAAWASLYNRRRGGQSDAWVPPHQRSCALTGRDLVPEDWRAEATAVNCYLPHASLSRTPDECERRVNLLRARYGDELTKRSWVRFLPTIAGADEAVDHGVRAAAVGAARGPAAVDEGVAAAAAQGGRAAGDGRGTTATDDGAAAANPRRPSVKAARQANAKGAAVDHGVRAAAHGRTAPARKMRGRAAGVVAAMAAQGGTATARDLFGGVIPPMRPRTGCSTSTSAAAARAPSFKGELVRPVSSAAAAAHGDPATTTAARDHFGGPVPKRPRTGSSTSAGAAGVPSVKEELVRLARDATSAIGGVGVAVDASDASLAAWADGRSDNAAVMAALGGYTTALGRMYLEL